MARLLNPEYVLRMLQKDCLRGIELIFVVNGMLGLTDETSNEIANTKDNAQLIDSTTCVSWNSPSVLYCKKCDSELRGIPRDYLQENRCPSCQRRFYDTKDSEKMDLIGYEIYKSHVIRYTMIARRKFHLHISGGEFLYRVKNIHVDHIFSKREAFERDISPVVVSFPGNLRVISDRENMSKGRKCDMTHEMLSDKYQQFLSKHPDWLHLIEESDQNELDSFI